MPVNVLTAKMQTATTVGLHHCICMSVFCLVYLQQISGLFTGLSLSHLNLLVASHIYYIHSLSMFMILRVKINATPPEKIFCLPFQEFPLVHCSSVIYHFLQHHFSI